MGTGSKRFLLYLPLVCGLATACGVLQESVKEGDSSVLQTFKEFIGYGGNESDGVLVVDGAVNGPSNPYFIDNVRSYITADASEGDITLEVSSASGFSAGQEILVVQMVGEDAGTFETVKIESISSNTLTLDDELEHDYTGWTGSEAAQVMKVPNYQSVTILSGGFLTVHDWDGRTGGVMFFRSTGKVWIKDDPGLDGTISVEKKGLVKTAFHDPCSASGIGGVNETSSKDPETLFAGGCGGGNVDPADGGRGGGLMIIKTSSELVVDGYLKADGETKTSLSSNPLGAGAGGTMLLVSRSVSSTALCSMTAKGGTGTGAAAGEAGKIFVYYEDTFTCSPGPDPANSATDGKFTPK